MKRKKNTTSKLTVKRDKIRRCTDINTIIKSCKDYFRCLLFDDYIYDSISKRLFMISRNLKITVLGKDKICDKHIEQMLNITRQNMKELYDKNPWGDIWKDGWNDDLKFQELSHETSNYIIMYKHGETSDSYLKGYPNVNLSGCIELEIEIVSFLCFRIELEEGYTPGKLYLVGYMYELQSTIKGSGYGKLLVDIFYYLCTKMKLEKVMCTVLRENFGARKFYLDKCKFVIDEISPVDEAYMILSKSIN